MLYFLSPGATSGKVFNYILFTCLVITGRVGVVNKHRYTPFPESVFFYENTHNPALQQFFEHYHRWYGDTFYNVTDIYKSLSTFPGEAQSLSFTTNQNKNRNS